MKQRPRAITNPVCMVSINLISMIIKHQSRPPVYFALFIPLGEFLLKVNTVFSHFSQFGYWTEYGSNITPAAFARNFIKVSLPFIYPKLFYAKCFLPNYEFYENSLTYLLKVKVYNSLSFSSAIFIGNSKPSSSRYCLKSKIQHSMLSFANNSLCLGNFISWQKSYSHCWFSAGLGSKFWSQLTLPMSDALNPSTPSLLMLSIPHKMSTTKVCWCSPSLNPYKTLR